jgi:hypothetical protein
MYTSICLFFRFSNMIFFYRLVMIILFLSFYANVSAQNKMSALPASQIDIPITINLKPVYALSEKNVDTVFTSPDYPNKWVQSDCATRYKYSFRRSPLKMSMSGTTLNLGFTGYYRIIGSTRACANGVVLSPWTPSCTCGFDEPERKVEVSFASHFTLRPDLVLQTRIVRGEPRPLDKCEVCFWGQNVTASVMNGLKAELDLSKKIMEDSFGRYNLRPYLQRAWNMLSDVYDLPGAGYFSLHPKSLRMNQLEAKNELLHINIGMTATPQVSFAKPEIINNPLPNLDKASSNNGFNIYLEAALQYDSLSKVLNEMLSGKKFEISEGIFNKHVIIKQAAISGAVDGDLRIMVDFTGSFDGTVFFRGKPAYDPEKRSIVVNDLEYDLKTKNLLLKTGKWLFNKKVISELKKYTSFELAGYFDLASASLNDWLNREWVKGIKGTGKVEALELVDLQALPGHILVRSNCKGKMNVTITEVNMNF